MSSESIIRISNVCKSFGRVQALEDVSLEVHKGEVLFIFGPSGGGKSTLLRCINRLEAVDWGEIIVDGINITHLPKKVSIDDVRSEVGMVFQLFNLFPHLSVTQNITLAQEKVRKRSREEATETALRLLDRVGLPEKADAYPNQLSGGQKQRGAIAGALAMNPKIMLLDEPTSALDAEMIREVLDVMLVLAREGMTMVVVSHEMGFARAVADRMVFLAGVRVVEIGATEDLYTNPKEERARQFLSQILR